MNLAKTLAALPVDFFFLVVDQFLDINLPQLPNFYSIFDPNLTVNNSGFLLSQTQTLDFIRQTVARSGHQAVIIPFKPSAKIDFICHKNHWLCAANPASLNRLFEDKIKFSQIITAAGLPAIPSVIGPLTSKLLSLAAKQFGLPLVLQTQHGWAGKSTYLIKNPKTILSTIPGHTPVKISPYLKGYTLLNNCCLTTAGLLQSPPALQFTGLIPLTHNPFTTVGRQWPSLAPAAILNQVKQLTDSFSQILKHYHYRGFFGLDFLVSRGKVYLQECNPRLTASFAFYTYLELQHHLNPLFYFHLLEFCAPDHIGNLAAENRFDRSDLTGAEITQKNDLAQTIQKYHDFKMFCHRLHPLSLDPAVLTLFLNEKN